MFFGHSVSKICFLTQQDIFFKLFCQECYWLCFTPCTFSSDHLVNKAHWFLPSLKSQHLLSIQPTHSSHSVFDAHLVQLTLITHEKIKVQGAIVSFPMSCSNLIDKTVMRIWVFTESSVYFYLHGTAHTYYYKHIIIINNNNNNMILLYNALCFISVLFKAE